MERSVIILAGGASSRMRQSFEQHVEPSPFTTQAGGGPKAMLRVGPGGRPFLDYLLYNIEASGYTTVVLVTREGDQTIRQYYDSEGHASGFPALRFVFVEQTIPPARRKPLGTADALMQALAALPELQATRFTVCNSDNLYSSTALSLLLHDIHENAMIAYDRASLQYPDDRISRFAICRRDAAGYLRDIVEKPDTLAAEAGHSTEFRPVVSMNIWRFSGRRILPYLESVPLHPQRDEKELPAAVKLMILENPCSLYAIPLAEHVPDLTSRQDIDQVQNYLRSMFPPTFHERQKQS